MLELELEFAFGLKIEPELENVLGDGTRQVTSRYAEVTPMNCIVLVLTSYCINNVQVFYHIAAA